MVKIDTKVWIFGLILLSIVIILSQTDIFQLTVAEFEYSPPDFEGEDIQIIRTDIEFRDIEGIDYQLGRVCGRGPGTIFENFKLNTPSRVGHLKYRVNALTIVGEIQVFLQNPSNFEYEYGTTIPIDGIERTVKKWYERNIPLRYLHPDGTLRFKLVLYGEGSQCIVLDETQLIARYRPQTDLDNDGVYDEDDLCQDTPITQNVDSNGCSTQQKDIDGDGIENNVDKCPNTQIGQAPDINGCSGTQRDTDNDSINDAEDACPVALGVVTLKGCPIIPGKDSDNDGILDNEEILKGTDPLDANDYPIPLEQKVQNINNYLIFGSIGIIIILALILLRNKLFK